MDVKRVLVFRAVARSGSLGAAARDLGWSQPAVSQHMRTLERQVGSPLVVRGPRGVQLTEAGEVLLVHADAIAARLTSAEDELAAMVSLQRGTVRIAAFPSACATVVPAAMECLAELHPTLALELTEAEPPEAAGLVEAGDVDAALVFGYEDTPDDDPPHLRRQSLGAEPMSVVLPQTHPLADRKSVRLGQLSGDRWIAGCVRCRAHLLASCERAGFVPDIRHSTDDYVVVQSLVARGLAVSLLPALALRSYHDPQVRTVPLAEAGRRRVSLIHHVESERTPALGALMSVLVDAARAAGIRA